MNARPLLVPFVLLGLACAGGKPPDGDLPGGNGDGNGDGNGGDDSVTDDSGGGPGRLCPAYTGLGYEGRSWEWSYTPEFEDELGYSSTWTVQTQSVDGDRVTTRSVGEIDHPSYQRYEWTILSTYRCDDDGAWFLGFSQETDYRIEGTDYWANTTITYTEPYLVMPAGAGEGDSWTSTYAGMSTTETGSSGPTSQDFEGGYTGSLHAHGDVTVPAGTFQVLEIRYDGEPSGWVDSDAGSVQSVSSHLVAYSP